MRQGAFVRTWRGWVLGIALLALLVPACRKAPAGEAGTPSLPPRKRDRPPVVMIGIDGGEWKVIRALWDEGRLPNLRRLADGGTSGVLRTAYGSSPVIWTTIATGRTPPEHGITDFVADSGKGMVPVSSSVRRVPALWNMASRAGLRTAVLGWWASWPAEDIQGVVITDRVHLTHDRIVHPLSYLPALDREIEKAKGEYPSMNGGLPGPDRWMDDGAVRDRIIAHEARHLVGLGFDLFLVYFRTVDIASHRYWKYYDPSHYSGTSQADIDRFSRVIPTVYEATDAAIGDLLAVLPPKSNVFVVSDHGFMPGREEPFIVLSTDQLLAHLGLLVRRGDAVDFARSIAYTANSPNHARLKQIRLSRAGREPGGVVPAEEVPGQIDKLARLLEGTTYEGGAPVFRVMRTGLPPGADLAAEVNLQDATLKVRVGDKTYDDVVMYIDRISGTHDDHTNGIFIAKGADLVSGVRTGGISVLDLAPTVLYALGLPAGEDFAGQVRQDLFTPEFRAKHRPWSVPSWGTMASWRVESSPVDARLLEELRALGYVSSP
jgi:predicted AlkP superfamily phosphohydrolase/phosphomutase